MPGGVAGARLTAAPYADQNGYLMLDHYLNRKLSQNFDLQENLRQVL